ncbi:hypothetical protein B0H14DRAFT_1342011 [Mycena olivaceomarginata]|nr:hypothetical protein B0H14DRAFT_1342011 [Mycena olivaceomarginata]
MTPRPVALLDSHPYLEPPARAFAAHSILLLRLPRRRRVPHNAHETHHITCIIFYPQVRKPPPTSRWTLKRCKGRRDTSRRWRRMQQLPFHLSSAHYLISKISSVSCDFFFIVRCFYNAQSVGETQTRAKASDERRMYSVAGGGVSSVLNRLDCDSLSMPSGPEYMPPTSPVIRMDLGH